MKDKFDIFRSLTNGQCMWIETVEGLEEAKRQLAALAQHKPGDYFIFDTSRGRRVNFAPAAS